MRTAMKLLLLVGLWLACAASAASMGGGKKYEAGVSRAAAGVTDDDIYAATVRVFADDGFAFIDKDKDAGIVTTSYRDAGMEGGLSTTRVAHAWRARIEEGTLRLEIGCQALGSNGPYPCSFRERNEDWVAAEPRYRQRIMDEAHRRAVKRGAPAADPEAEEPPAH